MADDLGAILDTIADEARRPRATFGSQILRCVKDAVLLGEAETYWFNDETGLTFPTVAARQSYGASDLSTIPYLTEIHEVKVAISSTDKRILTKKSWNEIQAFDPDGTSRGQPEHYAFAFKKIWMYPIPVDAWTTTVAGAYALTALAADVDTNCWTVEKEGGLLTRYRASALFYGTYLRQADRAASFQNLANAEVTRLVASTSRRQATGRIRRSL